MIDISGPCMFFNFSCNMYFQFYMYFKHSKKKCRRSLNLFGGQFLQTEHCFCCPVSFKCFHKDQNSVNFPYHQLSPLHLKSKIIKSSKHQTQNAMGFNKYNFPIEECCKFFQWLWFHYQIGVRSNKLNGLKLTV